MVSLKQPQDDGISRHPQPSPHQSHIVQVGDLEAPTEDSQAPGVMLTNGVAIVDT